MNQIVQQGEAIPFVIVGIVFLIGIVWLLRVTLYGARSLGQVALPPKPYKRVLLPAAAEMKYTPAAVSLACSLAGGGQPGSVLLTYIIEVPRSLAPDAPMPEEEAEASRVLMRAAEAVKRCGGRPIMQVRKSRQAVEETLRAIRDEKADLLVLMVPPDPQDPNTPQPFVQLTSELARRAPCEVVLARAA